MKTRTSGVLLAAVLLTGAFIGFVERRGSHTDQRRAAARLAFHIVPDAVRMLRMETTGGVIRCVRENDGWMLAEPVSAPADAAAIQRLLYALETLPREALITRAQREVRGQTLASYGFDPPQATLRLEGDGVRLSMEIGRAAPLGGLYVREPDRDTIVATTTHLLDVLPASPADLRDHTLFRSDPFQVRRIQIRRPEGFLQLARGENGGWSIQQPLAARGEGALVESWVEQLLRTKAVEFVRDGATDFAPYGFDEPGALEIQFDLDTIDPPTVALAVGRIADPATGRRYARWKGNDTVFTVAAEIEALANRPVNELRDRRLAAFDPASILSVSVQRGEQSLLLEKRSGAWFITQPSEAPADGALVDQFMREWAAMRVEDFMPSAAATNHPALGLDPPYARLSFSREAGVTSGTNGVSGTIIRIAGVKPHPEGWIAAVYGEEIPVWIRPPMPSLTSPQPLLFRSRNVLQFDPATLRSVTRIRDGNEQRLERNPAGGWEFPAGAQGVLERGRIDALTAELSNLSADALIADRPASLEEYGLEHPATVLTLTLDGEEKTSKTLLFGRSTAQGTHVTIRGQALVFLIDNPLAERLQEELYLAPATETSKTTPAAAPPGGAPPL
ncbi:MAG: DUF4340 domain-containing protein [Kiritimatiellae bacterium]|nr:DUF4340 domain-containing protein [Kiritimatiellia bacterium]